MNSLRAEGIIWQQSGTLGVAHLLWQQHRNASRLSLLLTSIGSDRNLGEDMRNFVGAWEYIAGYASSLVFLTFIFSTASP